MIRLLTLVALCLFVASPASAQIDHDLTVTLVDPIPCVNPGFVQSGQQIRIQMTGFAPNASVELGWMNVELFEKHMVTETVTADSGGVVNVVRAVPTSLGATTPGEMAFISLSGPGATQFRTGGGPFIIIPATTTDGDSDGVADSCDSCPALPNAGANQADDDGDNIGNLCDSCPDDPINDTDEDGLCGDVDPCPRDAENDADGDGVCEEVDNCPLLANPNQIDNDRNRVGDACQTMPDCSDGVDNDRDGRIDHPDDPGCTSPTDTSENQAGAACDDGIDNDGDGLTDVVAVLGEVVPGIPGIIGFAGDPGCGNQPDAPKEDPQCDNKVDDDMDTFVDARPSFRFGTTEDPQCAFPSWDSELVPEPAGALGAVAMLFALGALGARRRE